MIYCMQAHEDKISAKCAFELGEAADNVQTAADALKDGVIACKAEINGVCGKIVPGQGRIAACLLANKSTASTGCAEALKKDRGDGRSMKCTELDLAIFVLSKPFRLVAPSMGMVRKP